MKKRTFKIRLPGFIIKEEIGLGDAIKKIALGFGIRPCGSCVKRADSLNKKIYFINRRSNNG